MFDFFPRSLAVVDALAGMRDEVVVNMPVEGLRIELMIVGTTEGMIAELDRRVIVSLAARVIFPLIAGMLEFSAGIFKGAVTVAVCEVAMPAL